MSTLKSIVLKRSLIKLKKKKSEKFLWQNIFKNVSSEKIVPILEMNG